MQFLSIDIGGTYTKYAVVTNEGQIVHQGKMSTPDNLDDLVTQLIAVKKNLQADWQLDGISLSCPGKVQKGSHLIEHGGSLPYLDQQELTKLIGEDDFPESHLLTINDAKAAALAEYWQGTLVGSKQSLVVTLGTAIGGAILINGEVLEGSHFQAGELSFIAYTGQDRSLSNRLIPNIGDSLSAVGFVEAAAKILGLPSAKGELVFDSIARGDHILQPLFKQYCKDLANVLLTVDTVLDLDRIAIGGGVSSQPILIQEISHQLQILHDSIKARNQHLTLPVVVACQFQNDANLLGSAYALMKQIGVTQ